MTLLTPSALILTQTLPSPAQISIGTQSPLKRLRGGYSTTANARPTPKLVTASYRYATILITFFTVTSLQNASIVPPATSSSTTGSYGDIPASWTRSSSTLRSANSAQRRTRRVLRSSTGSTSPVASSTRRTCCVAWVRQILVSLRSSA